MNNFYPLPNRILPPEKKDGKYTVKFGKGIYFNWRSGNFFMSFSRVDRFKNNRSYSAGEQDEEQYMPQFCMHYDNKTKERQGLANLNYSIVPFAPRIVNSAIEMMNSTTNRTNVVFLNDVANEERSDLKLKMQVDIENKDFIKDINGLRGVKSDFPSNMPENKEALDALEEAGGLKLPVETALELGIEYVFDYENLWEKKHSDEIKRDGIENSVCAAVSYINPVTNMIELRVPNIERIVMDGSPEKDYADATYFGEIRDCTVLDVYNEVKRTTGKIITEEELKTLGLTNDTYTMDAYGREDDWFSSPMDRSMYGYLSQRVRVLDFIYLSTDIIKSPRKKFKKVEIPKRNVKKGELKSGKIKEENGKFYKQIKQKSDTVEATVWRKGKWLIDTEIAYDHGLCFSQIRDNEFRPIAPFRVFRINGKSIIDIIKPDLDALQIDHLKLQNMKAKMRGYGLIIEYEAITNIMMGGEDMGPADIIQLSRLANDLIYKRKKSGNHGLDRMGNFPIQEHQGGMGRAFDEILKDIAMRTSNIMVNTGLNEVVLSQNPNPETTYGQAQLAQVSGKNAIANIYKAYKNVKEHMAYIVALFLEQKAKEEKDSKYAAIIGKKLWKALGDKRETPIRAQGIKIMDNPSEEEIQALYLNIQKIAPNTVTGYDLFLIQSMVKEGKPLKAIAAIMESKARKREKEANEANKQMMENNSKQQQDMVKLSLQGDIAKIREEIRGDLAEIAAKLEGERVLQQEKYDLEGERTANEK
jgi:hypothetical protein